MKGLLKNFILALLWSGTKRILAVHQPYVIAITGSVGKTSTKEAVAAIFAAAGKPFVKTTGNMGTESGVPLSLLGFEESPSGIMEWLSAICLALFPPIKKFKDKPYYVLEYSADKPGDIAYLAQRIPPRVGVLTRIVPVHMQMYPQFADLVNEKFSLFSGLLPEGYAVLNADDPVQREKAGSLKEICWYGIVDKPLRKEGVWAHSLQPGKSGLTCTLEFVTSQSMDSIGRKQSQTLHLHTQVIGRHHLYPLLAAAAVGLKEGVTPAQIKAGLESYQLPSGRGRIIEGQKGITIIDDTYNASPEAVKAGLDMLPGFAAQRRTVAILGTMNELGETAPAAHREVAVHAVGKADYLVFVGKYGEEMREAAQKAGQPDVQVIAFSTPESLLHNMEQLVQSRDLVYIKGSQNGVRLERAVKRIMAHPEQAEHLLVRQSAFWKTKA